MASIFISSEFPLLAFHIQTVVRKSILPAPPQHNRSPCRRIVRIQQIQNTTLLTLNHFKIQIPIWFTKTVSTKATFKRAGKLVVVFKHREASYKKKKRAGKTILLQNRVEMWCFFTSCLENQILSSR